MRSASNGGGMIHCTNNQCYGGQRDGEYCYAYDTECPGWPYGASNDTSTGLDCNNPTGCPDGWLCTNHYCAAFPDCNP